MPCTSALVSLTTFYDHMETENCIPDKSEIFVSVISSGCVPVSCYLKRLPKERWIVGCIAGERLDESKSFVFGRIRTRHTEDIFGK